MKLKRFLIGSAEMKYFLIISLIILSSCSSVKNQVSKPPLIQVSVKNLDHSKSWEVTYEVSQPVFQLIFIRQENQFREKTWTVLNNKEMEITNIDNHEVIISKSGKSFTKVTLTHKSNNHSFEKDYEFFIDFSKFETLMYTGHYNVIPVFKNHSKKEVLKITGPITEHLFKFYSDRKDMNIIVDGKVSNDEVFWTEKGYAGTYVFWGQKEPEEYNELILVLGENVPAWVKESVKNTLPNLFKFYEKKLGLKLSFNPVVYLNYSSETTPHISNSGGTLPGLVQLTIKGSPWQIKSDLTQEWLFWFLAHEAAHLWNSQMIKKKGGGVHAWMHEGSANAFALHALLEFKLISQEKYLTSQKKEVEDCKKGLTKGSPLSESNKLSQTRNYYTCGHLIASLTEKTTGHDIFYFWKQLIKEQRSKDSEYGHGDYFALWDRLSGQKEIIKSVKTLVYRNSNNLESLIKFNEGN